MKHPNGLSNRQNRKREKNTKVDYILINNEFKFNFETTNFEVLQRNGKQDPINFQNNREKIEPKIVFSRILSEKQHEIQEIENAISNSYQNQNVVETINQTVNAFQKNSPSTKSEKRRKMEILLRRTRKTAYNLQDNYLD
jgi:hypothetical protein